MNNVKITGSVWLATALLALGMAAAQAQTTASWSGAVDTDWNTPGNWDIGVPAEGTNATVGNSSFIVNYNNPMAATSFASLSLSGVLNVNAAGFNINPGSATAPFTTSSGAVLAVGASGAVSLVNAGATSLPVGFLLTNNGSILFSNAGAITLANGASPVNILTLNAGSTTTITNSAGTVGLNIGSGSSSSQGAIATMTGGTLNVDKIVTVQGTSSRFFISGGTANFYGGVRVADANNDGAERLDISGGAVVNMGNFSVGRCTSAGGLVVGNGIVNATGIQIGTNNSTAFATINTGGIVTNTGVFNISDNTNAAASSDRRSQFLIRGGTVVSTAPAGIILANQANGNPSVTVANANIGGVLDINAGSLTAEKITLIRDSTVTNAYARLNLSGSGIIYLGSGGLAANVGPSKTAFNIALSGGTLAAKADWASTLTAVMPMSGTVTFQAADAAGGAHNITLSNLVSGSGAVLAKTGGGSLILLATNTYTGNTLINAGTLVLGPTGSILSSSQIVLTNGAVLDVSTAGNPTLGGSQALVGSGSVNGSLTAPTGSALRPGGIGSVGTLTFNNSLSESNIVNHFDLSTNTAAGSNDFINIAGDLNLSGTNTILVNPVQGPLPVSNTYKLIQYGGNLASGSVANLQLSGAVGVLTNDPTAKAIFLTVSSGIRGSTNVVWRGDGGANNWDLLISSNWLNAGTGARDYFVSGDNARFDNSGASNQTLTVVGSVVPGSMTVDSSSNYVFSGTGTIDGTGGLSKTNSGTLTILTLNNTYSGATIIGGGTIEVQKLAASGAPCSLGSANNNPTNLQFYGSSLRYLGGNVTTDRGATFNGTSTVDVTNSATSLTENGTLVGTGGLTKSGAGTLVLSGTSAYSDVTTVSNGTLQINGSTTAALATNPVIFAGGTLFLNVSGQPTYANAFNVVANSSLNVGANNTLFTGAWSGSNTLNVNVSAGGFFTINSAMNTNFTGTLAMGASGGLLRFNGGGGSPCLGSDYCTFDLGTSTNALVNRNGGGLVYGLGGLAGGPGTQLRGSENTGSGSIYQVGSNGQNTTFGGTIKTGNGGAGAMVTLLKVGSGTLTLTGTNTYNGPTTISAGALALSGGGSIGNTPTITVFTNTVLDASGRTDGTLTLNSGQTLLGSGTVRGSVVVKSGAILTVGDDTGIPESMVITNALTLQANSTLNMDVDHYLYVGAATNDVIKGLASVTYGGTLNLGVNSIETNSVFKLFNAGSYHGAFAAITPALPPFSPAVWAWDTSQLTVDGTLRIKALTPSFGNIDFSSLLSGGTITLNAINGFPNAPVQVLTSTNIALPMVQWTTNATTFFDGSGTINNFLITVDPKSPQLYIRLQE